MEIIKTPPAAEKSRPTTITGWAVQVARGGEWVCAEPVCRWVFDTHQRARREMALPWNEQPGAVRVRQVKITVEDA